MAEPDADRGDVDEAQEALCGFVVAGGDAAGILELVEAALDQVAQAIELAVDGDAEPSGLSHRDYRHDVSCLHGFANIVRVMAAIRQQDAGRGRVVGHDRVEAQIVLSAPA